LKKRKEIHRREYMKEVPKEVQKQLEVKKEAGVPNQKLHLVAEAKLMQETTELCTSLVEDIWLKISHRGLQMIAINPEKVALVDLVLKSVAFTEYDATDFEIPISLTKLANIIKLAKDSVQIDYDIENQQLLIKMDTLTRKMRILDARNVTEPTSQPLVEKAKFTMPTSHFIRTLIASDQVSESIRFTVDKEYVELFAEGDTDSVLDKVPKERTDILTSLEATAKCSSSYTLEYLRNMAKGAKEDIDFHIANESPVKMEYRFAEGNGKVQYFLAPRIETDDEEKKNA
jgi:proliferating cell nuclear antigen